MTRPLARAVKGVLARVGRRIERVGEDLLVIADRVPESRRLEAHWKYLGQRVMAELLTELEIDCVIDVGANVGQFALAIRETGWRGPMVSFEPQGTCQAALKEASAGDHGWTVIQAALSDHDGTTTLSLRSNSEFTSLQELRLDSKIATAPGIRPLLDTIGTETVPVRRLDQVMAEIPQGRSQRIFLKIDTQGHDEMVLAGAAGILPRVAALRIEMSQDPLYQETSSAGMLIERLGRAGFLLAGTFPVFREARTGAMLEFDAVFVQNI